MGADFNIDILCRIAEAFSAFVPPFTEIVVHDMRSFTIEYIANGHVTGRAIGDKLDSTVLGLLNKIEDIDHALTARSEVTKFGRPLKCSRLIIRDDAGEAVAALCINSDISKLAAVRDAIDGYLAASGVQALLDPALNPDTKETLLDITYKIIVSELDKLKLRTYETKEAKLCALQNLDSRGVFSMKDAVPLVCDLLSISQSTLYNYLRELRHAAR